jgi:outer membrane protein TolC
MARRETALCEKAARLSFAFFVCLASARAGNAKPDSFTLDSYIAFALRNNPGIKAARSDVEAARESQGLYTSLPDPMLMASVQTGSDAGFSRAGITQTIPFPSTLILEHTASVKRTGKSESRLVAAMAGLESRIRTSYADLYRTGRSLAIQKENLALLRRWAEVEQTRYSVESQGQAALLKALVEIAVAENEIASLESQAQSQRWALAALLPFSPASDIPFPDSLPPFTLELESPLIASLVESRNPSIAAARFEQEESQTMLKVSRSRIAPDLFAGAEYMFPEEVMADGHWNVNFGASLPLWPAKHISEVKTQKSLERQAAARLEDLQNDMASRAVMLLNEYSDAQRMIKLLTAALIPQARQVLELTSTQYRTAKITALEFFEAQRTLLSLNLRLVDEEARSSAASAGILAILGAVSNPAASAAADPKAESNE